MGGIYKERKAIVVGWDVGDYEGPVSIKTSNPGDLEDVSGTELVGNPGYAALTYPLDFVGESHVQVFGGDELLDEFDIQVD
jgi:hypothetical protein